MTAAREFRDRDDVEVAILNALVERDTEGMTVFELRTHVGADIDDIESALAALKRDGLIDVEPEARSGNAAVIKPADRVVPAEETPDRTTLLEWLREQFPF